MCTLPIIGTPGGGYLLGHNRDESRSRPPGEPPERGELQGRAWMAPRDPEGGGSWIGINDSGTTFALLNAAHADPARLPVRPPTRGRLLTTLLTSRSPEEVRGILEGDDRLGETRGFHLVMVIPGDPRRAAEACRFLWDGRSLECTRHALPALFVSSGYDQAAVEAARGEAWSLFLQGCPAPRAAGLARWLASHEPERGLFSVCMHGDRAGTVSRTLVEVGAATARMTYHPGPACEPGAHDHHLELPIRP